MPAAKPRSAERGDEEDIDDQMALLSLIATLSLEDIEHVRGRSKGKSLEGVQTDDELALQLFAEEAGALETMAHDFLQARSLDRALESDAQLLEEFARLEEVARRDRAIAIALAEGRPLPQIEAAPGPLAVFRSIASSDTALAIPTVAGRGGSVKRTSTALSVAVPSSSSASGATKTRAESCVICRDTIEGPVVRAPCGDPYDVGCLVDLFRAATVDESLFPPACCRKPFDLGQVRVYLDSKLQKLFDKKVQEFGTKNRVYCHKPTCSAFLGAATASPTDFLCTTCWAHTCGHCKAARHSRSIRCTNEEDAGVIALAEQAGWKRCPGCGHLVELTIGCYHMMCRCRHQFCYLCTAVWKTCTCTQWDENRLIAVAEDRVRRQGAQGGGGNAVEHRQRVAREAERLRIDHDCVHRWRYVTTAGNCEGCGHYLRLFLFNCKTCQMWCCARCRRNRWV